MEQLNKKQIRHLSEEIKKKISDSKKGKPNLALSKRVGAYKDGELIMTFQSTREAGRNGFNQCNVSACCVGKLNTHRGYLWRFLDNRHDSDSSLMIKTPELGAN